MRSLIFRVLGGSLLTMALVWALVLAWWQSNDHQPEQGELILYLGVLPLALIGGYWLLRGFIEHLAQPPEVKAATPALPVDDDPLSGTRARTAAAERQFVAHLIDAFVVSAAGRSADEVLAAIDAGKRPEPQAALTDDEGFPVFAAVVKDPEVAAVVEALAESRLIPPPLAGRPEILRALALLHGVLTEAGDRLATLLDAHPGKLHLDVVWLLPASWGQESVSGLRAWLHGLAWPVSSLGEPEFSLIPVAGDGEVLQQLDALILSANQATGAGQLTLLAGAVSAVDPQSVARWEAARRLFSPHHQDRSIPGEGAFALLLASPQAQALLAIQESVLVSRVAHGVRDKPVNAGGRVGGQLIGQLVAGVLDVGGLPVAAVKAVVGDADHRAANLTEMLEGIGSALDHLDPLKDCPACGTSAGTLTPFGGLMALACASAKVRALDAPVLCLSNQHERERAVLLARPCLPPGDPQPACI